MQATDPTIQGRLPLAHPWCVSKSKLATFASFLTTSQLVEQVLIERFILVLGAGGQENVTTDVFMHDFAICTQAGERNGDVLVKLDRHLEGKAQVSLTSDQET